MREGGEGDVSREKYIGFESIRRGIGSSGEEEWNNGQGGKDGKT